MGGEGGVRRGRVDGGLSGENCNNRSELLLRY